MKCPTCHFEFRPEVCKKILYKEMYRDIKGIIVDNALSEYPETEHKVIRMILDHLERRVEEVSG
jgi:transcription termination factor Rho